MPPWSISSMSLHNWFLKGFATPPFLQFDDGYPSICTIQWSILKDYWFWHDTNESLAMLQATLTLFIACFEWSICVCLITLCVLCWLISCNCRFKCQN